MRTFIAIISVISSCAVDVGGAANGQVTPDSPPSTRTEDALSPVEKLIKPKLDEVEELLILQTAEKGIALVQFRVIHELILNALLLKHSDYNSKITESIANLEGTLKTLLEEAKTANQALTDNMESIFSPV